MTGSRLGGHRTLRSRAGQFPGSRKLMFYRATSLRIMHPIDVTMGARKFCFTASLKMMDYPGLFFI